MVFAIIEYYSGKYARCVRGEMSLHKTGDDASVFRTLKAAFKLRDQLQSIANTNEKEEVYQVWPVAVITMSNLGGPITNRNYEPSKE